MNEITARIVVPHDPPSLAGHFPGHPIVPGVVLLDEVFAVMQASLGNAITLAAITSTKFLQAVSPANELDVRVNLTPAESGHWKARFICSRNDAAVLEGSFLLTGSLDGAQ